MYRLTADLPMFMLGYMVAVIVYKTFVRSPMSIRALIYGDDGYMPPRAG